MSGLKEEHLRDAISFQIDFYERLLNIYSLIFRLTDVIKSRERLLEEIPELLVRVTQFETCYAVFFSGSKQKESFYSLTRREPDLDTSIVNKLLGKGISPSVHFDSHGYGALFIYPLTLNFELVGIVALGKEGHLLKKEDLNLQEIEIILRILERLIGYSMQSEVDLTKNIPIPILFVDLSGRIVYANEGAKRALSSISTSLEGIKLEKILPEFQVDLLKEEESYTGEISFRTASGPKVYEISVFPVSDRKDKPVLRGVMLKDITAEKKAEEESFYRAKMETLGMLSAGVAHDFNNILTSILGYVSMLKGLLSQEEKLLKYAEVIERSALRAANLIKHLLNFSRRHRMPSHQFDLHSVLDDCLFLIGESFRDIVIVKHFDDIPFLLKGDESEFQHVFLNLFLNAKDAMEGRGTLTVKTERVMIWDKSFVKVSIEDSGKGMDKNVIENIFKPHFSTKEYGSHLGIGLHRVEETVRRNGGFIEVESEKGKGTKFHLYIPLTYMRRTEDPSPQISPSEGKPNRSMKKVLVVDDEEAICEMLQSFLSERYNVRACKSGEEALRILEGEEFDLVLLDIIMPGIKGDEVLGKLRQKGKKVKVLVISGYVQEERLERIKRLGVDGFLQKPFRREEILNAVEEALSKD